MYLLCRCYVVEGKRAIESEHKYQFQRYIRKFDIKQCTIKLLKNSGKRLSYNLTAFFLARDTRKT